MEKRLGVDFKTDEGERFIHRQELFALVQQLSGATISRIFPEAFDDHAVCWGEYHTVCEVLRKDFRLSTANPMFERISHPSGETLLRPIRRHRSRHEARADAACAAPRRAYR